MFSISNQHLPERRLLAAVLQRAVFDYIGAVAEDRQEAAEWFFSNPVNEDEFSFNWICSQLNVDPGMLRNQLVNMKRLEGKVTPQQWLAQKLAA